MPPTPPVPTALPNNTVSYLLTVGVGDNKLFSIDANSNVRFKASPDYETPMDSDHDNEYGIQVSATDGLHAHDAALHVAIAVSDLLLL
jgi:S-adenosylhomocysteine hydrolase